MSRAEKIFKGIVAATTGALGLLAKRDYDELQTQKIKRKADLTFAADDLLSGREVNDPRVAKDAKEMIKFYGLKPYDLRTCSESRCNESEMADSRAPHRSVLDIREERSAGNLPFTAIAGRDSEQVLRPKDVVKNPQAASTTDRSQRDGRI